MVTHRSKPSPEDPFAEPGVTGLEGVLVRELRASDLDHVVRVDARVGGRPRREYYQRKLAEAERDTSIRISLAAEAEGTFAGFLIGRLYYGEFGMPEPVAIIDSIGVDPNLRGRHVGAALLAQLETNLRAVGIESLRTEVEWDRFDLLGFLAGHGFRPAPMLCLQKSINR
ncbi:MAG: GNAT family N-acetyltransferase [Planctomycetes bacterium]|nr:GNAT family N-acetyltransferase [Planctomycetota bacterium]